LIPSGSNGEGFEAFNFDYVANEEANQEEIFSIVGKPIVD
jgi:hypothetical protein